MSETQIEAASRQEAPQASPILLQSLRIRNLLSFGSDMSELPLASLNVLIGPNGSGKSNLIEAIALLRASATDIADTIRRGGGVQEWIWKGTPDATAWVEAVIAYSGGVQSLRHHIAFAARGQAFHLVNEEISDARGLNENATQVIHYRFGEARSLANGSAEINTFYDADDSVLRQLRDPFNHPQITYLARQYETIRLYREWQFGRNTAFRVPQRADMRNDRLEEDLSNLGLFLNRLRRDPKAKRDIIYHLRDIYEGVDDFDVSVEGGTVQVFLTEGEFTVPATRLSDGTLRYLCLLAILCDPKPPPLICIEEPELGLHPDILPKIADLLVEASGRTQLVVTTHSDILVDAMTERPEAVLVCEKRAGQTHITRLSREDLSMWLDKYRLGELWTRGELGGTRW